MQFTLTHKRLLNLLFISISGGKCDTALFCSMTQNEWKDLLFLSRLQGISAIAFEALDYLPANCRPPKDTLIEWLGVSISIESHYNKHLQLANELARLWAMNGLRTMVFKGLAHCRYYTIPSHREFGDFDCFLFKSDPEQNNNEISAFLKGNALARDFGAEVYDGWYKHSKINYKGLSVENHQYFTATRSSKNAKKLNAYMIASLCDGSHLNKLIDTEILLPPLELEGLFMLYHSQMHFLVEGISLRHYVDWAFWIRSNQSNIDWESFSKRCKEFGLYHFVVVLNAIVEKYFGVVLKDNIERDSTFSEKVILSALLEDSPICSKNKGRWYERFRLISNAFKYSWKFRDVVHYSRWEYLWNYIWGFLLKEED